MPRLGDDGILMCFDGVEGWRSVSLCVVVMSACVVFIAEADPL